MTARCWNRCGRASPRRSPIHGQAARQRTHRGEPGEQPAFFGMMPASISHEGYSQADAFGAGTISGPCAVTTTRHRALAGPRRRRRAHRRVARPVKPTSALRSFHHRAAPHRLPAGRSELGDFDPTSEHDRAGAGRCAVVAAAGTAAQTRSSVTGTNPCSAATASARGRTTPYELRTVGSFVRRAGANARTRCSISSSPGSSHRAGGSGAKWSRPRRANVLPRRPAACLGGIGLHPLVAGHARLRARRRAQLVLAAGVPADGWMKASRWMACARQGRCITR